MQDAAEPDDGGGAPPEVSNLPPVVSNVRATLDRAQKRVSVRFDLADAESDSMEVWLRVSDDGGATFLAPTNRVTGDVGFPVHPGTQKLVVWQYDELSLSGAYVARIVADDRAASSIQSIVDQVDSARLVADVAALQGVRHYDANPAGMAAAKAHIEAQFTRSGLQVTRQPFTFRSWSAENLVGRHPGLVDEATTYIIDGHFDTVAQTPGADDNASAVAGMLEAMRVLSRYGFRHSLSFVGFDLEEVGIIGSREYVRNGLPDWQRTRGVVNFEMIGYTCTAPGCDRVTGNGTAIYNVADANSERLHDDFNAAARLYAPGLTVLPLVGDAADPALRRSDHFRFWDSGTPALFINDGGNFRNPNYHRPSDLIGTLDFAFMTNVVRATVATLATKGLLVNAGVGTSQPFN